MPAAAQMDLWDALTAEAPPIFPPPRPADWEAILGRTIGSRTLWVHTSRRWTGVVVETLCAPDLRRRWILWRDRRGFLTTDYPAVSTALGHRTVFLAPHDVHLLHRRLPLIQFDHGDGWARYRPAAPGEAVPELLAPLSETAEGDMTNDR